MKQSYADFLDTVKVIRMLYGVTASRDFFEKNFTTFTGQDIQVLHKLIKLDTIDSTLES